MKRIAVFASGSGSNYQAIMEFFAEHAKIQVALLVCDQPQAKVIDRAKHWQTPTLMVSPKDFPSKASYERHILSFLEEYQIDFLVLAGYMRLIGPILLEPYSGRIINIHPSLLPAFPGKDAIGQALAYGVKVTGVTIHFVDEGMDTGPIIVQKAVEVSTDDDLLSLSSKIQQIEHALYPPTVEDCVLGKVYLQGRKVCYREGTS
ncbi:MAG: phosphoribosylglycinamide formyltransferase [Firmicutes bacterium]|nr:phosphoribosylglycinamide formyltransferase [Bacillota bacterium]